MKKYTFKFENDYYTAIEYLYNLAKKIEDSQEIIIFEPESHLHKIMLGNITRMFDMYNDNPEKKKRGFVVDKGDINDIGKSYVINLKEALFYNNNPKQETKAVYSYEKEHPENEDFQSYLKNRQDSGIEKYSFIPNDTKLILNSKSDTKNTSDRVARTKAEEYIEGINKKRNKPEIPAELLTDAAEKLWQSLRKAGFIVANGYSLVEGVSANQATFIAYYMAEKLKIQKKWKVFQQLWGIQHMAQMAGAWKQTGKELPRANEIRDLFK